MTRKQKKMLVRIIIATVLIIVLSFVQVDGILLFGMYLIPYFVIGYDILWNALWGILHGQLMDENFLMAVATIGAMALALLGRGDYTEGIAVMLFYQIGEWFQSYAVGKSRRSIRELMDIRPDHAWIEVDGELFEKDPSEVAVGSIVTVKPGEKVPLDGVIIDGNSTLDTAALTGESLPREVCVGDEIISGCINMTGLLKLRTTKEFGESTVSKILDLVENASSRKSKSEDFISKFARIYTPAVCIAALVLAIIPPVVRMFCLGLTADFGEWMYRALTFLVISCPCALVISIPLTFFAGIGGASRAGVLVKGSNYLETLAQVDTVVMDKTGTLTEGVFAVTDICPSSDEISEKYLLEMAAIAESASTHPIARSICKELERYGKKSYQISEIKEIGGRGVTAVAMIDGVQSVVVAGNDKLMSDCGIETADEADTVGTIVHVAVDGKYLGKLVISDMLKPTSAEAMAELKKIGIKKTVMLTGDTNSVAEKIGGELGLDEIHSELLPADKVELVENLIINKQDIQSHKKIAFVGDGINDAPVLSRADIGIAMGAMGADAAIEAADVVLMDDDPRKIALAIAISRKCLSIVYQNIVFALGVKMICLILGAIGYANMGLAIFADVGVMVIAVCNAIRALRIKK